MSVKTNNSRKNEVKYLEDAIGALAFWIGYNRSKYYRRYLGEAAIVAELCNLIHANLDKTQIVFPEILYKNINTIKSVNPRSDEKSPGGKQRADIVIFQRNTNTSLEVVKKSPQLVQHVIEVKKYGNIKAIEYDIKRLHNYLKHAPKHVRCFLIVASEAKRPSRFVTSGGNAVRNTNAIQVDDIKVVVKRVTKASHSFTKRDSAHYVCLLEVVRA